MGQVNCQCQQALLHESDSVKDNNKKEVHLSANTFSDETETTQIYFRVVLSNPQGGLQIKMREGEKMTFGTTVDCDQRHISSSLNSFKMQIKLCTRHLTVKDCGVGYGVFLMKKKVMVKCEGQEMLFSLEDCFLMVKISAGQQIAYSVFGVESERSGIMSGKGEQTIEVGRHRVVLRREREGREYSVRRQDRSWLCVLLSEERRVRGGDVLRLGSEFFEVESISSYIEASQVVNRH